MEYFTQYFGLIEIILFYGVALAVCFWQWSKMRREVREMRAKREAREAQEKTEAEKQATDEV